MSAKKQSLQPPETPTLRAALSDLLQETDTANCLSLEQMTDYAQEALTLEQRGVIQTHVQECSLCATTVADLRQAYRPVIVLHRGLAGWRGPILAYLRWLLPDARRLWQSHVGRCMRCRRRTERLQAVFTPPVTLAMGAACAALLLFSVGRPNTGTAKNSQEEGGFRDETPKGGRIDTTPGQPPWPTAVSVLEGYLYPGKNLDEITKYWLQILAKHPDSLAAREALARIYEQHAAVASDPRRKAGWKEQAQAERAQMSILLSQNRSTRPEKRPSSTGDRN